MKLNVVQRKQLRDLFATLNPDDWPNITARQAAAVGLWRIACDMARKAAHKARNG